MQLVQLSSLVQDKQCGWHYSHFTTFTSVLTFLQLGWHLHPAYFVGIALLALQLSHKSSSLHLLQWGWQSIHSILSYVLFLSNYPGGHSHPIVGFVIAPLSSSIQTKHTSASSHE